ncbi:MAG: hypothetical protein KDB27_05300 [Planctomycetales bacterium]|nr:hypothetical protein [Planctomycetales bacterium]
MPRSATPSEPNAVSGPFKLRVRNRFGNDHFVPVEDRITIGRSPQCTIRLDQDTLAPVECLIVNGKAGTILRRWQGRPTINDQAFEDVWLNPGDVLRIGTTEFQLSPEPHRENPEVSFSDSAMSADELHESRAALAEARERSVSLAKQISKLKEECEALRRTISDKDRDISNIKSELEIAAGNKDSLERHIETLNVQIQQKALEVEQTNRSWQKQVQDLLVQLGVSSDAWQSFGKNGDPATDYLTLIGASIRASLNQQDNVSEQVAELETRVSDIDAREHEIEKQVREIESQQIELEQMRVDLQAARTDLENAQHEFQSQQQAWEVEHHNLIAQFNSVRSAFERERTTLEARQAELAASAAESCSAEEHCESPIDQAAHASYQWQAESDVAADETVAEDEDTPWTPTDTYPESDEEFSLEEGFEAESYDHHHYETEEEQDTPHAFHAATDSAGEEAVDEYPAQSREHEVPGEHSVAQLDSDSQYGYSSADDSHIGSHSDYEHAHEGVVEDGPTDFVSAAEYEHPSSIESEAYAQHEEEYPHSEYSYSEHSEDGAYDHGSYAHDYSEYSEGQFTEHGTSGEYASDAEPGYDHAYEENYEQDYDQGYERASELTDETESYEAEAYGTDSYDHETAAYESEEQEEIQFSAPSGDAPIDTAAILAKYGMSNELQNEEPFEGPATIEEPTLPEIALSPQLGMAQYENVGGDDSIEEYMAQLLNRVGGKSPAPVVEAKKPQQKQPVQTIVEQAVSSASDVKEELPPLRPEEFVPRTKQPQLDLSSMRSIANETARSDINRHLRKTNRRVLAMRWFMATCSFIAGGILLLWGTLIGAGLAFVLGVYMALRACGIVSQGRSMSQKLNGIREKKQKKQRKKKLPKK